jgi:hypothetical protein
LIPRENDGRKPDHARFEELRTPAVKQAATAEHQEAVAAALGMARARVFGRPAKYREGGPQASRARPVPGKPPKLNGAQPRRLYTLIVGADLRRLRSEFAL